MDPLLTGLMNFGAMGALAAILLMLHREALKTFKEELNVERKRCDEHRARADAHHEAVMQKLSEESEQIVVTVQKEADAAKGEITATKHAVKELHDAVRLSNYIEDRMRKPGDSTPPPPSKPT